MVVDLFFCASETFTRPILYNKSLVSDWSSLSIKLNNNLSLVIQVDNTSTVIDLPHRLCTSHSSKLLTYSHLTYIINRTSFYTFLLNLFLLRGGLFYEQNFLRDVKLVKLDFLFIIDKLVLFYLWQRFFE